MTSCCQGNRDPEDVTKSTVYEREENREQLTQREDPTISETADGMSLGGNRQRQERWRPWPKWL